MNIDDIDPRRLRYSTLFFIGTIAAILIFVSFIVRVRIIVENPSYGDVTNEIEVVWRAILAIATLGSFLLGLRNLAGEDPQSNSPETGFVIRGEGNSVEVNLYWSPEEEPFGDNLDVNQREDPSESKSTEDLEEGTDKNREQATDES